MGSIPKVPKPVKPTEYQESKAPTYNTSTDPAMTGRGGTIIGGPPPSGASQTPTGVVGKKTLLGA